MLIYLAYLPCTDLSLSVLYTEYLFTIRIITKIISLVLEVGVGGQKGGRREEKLISLFLEVEVGEEGIILD